MDTLNAATLSNCILSNLTIYKSTVTKSTFRNAKIYNSALTSCELHNCRLFGCSFISCKLYNSKIIGAKLFLKCELKDTDLIGTGSTLEDLPVEVREMIFKMCLDWNGKTPALVAALRGNKELYQQAMEIFRKMNFFRIDFSNFDMAKSMPSSIKRGIVNLEIHIDGLLDNEQVVPLLKELNLRALQLYQKDILRINRLFKCLIHAMQQSDLSLQTFTLHWRNTELMLRSEFIRRAEAISVFKNGFQSGGFLTESIVCENGQELFATVQTWKAAPGKTLTWNLTPEDAI